MAIRREKELKKWNRQKKEDLINKKNPEWKVLVTENGFIRNTTPFSQQVNDLVNELQQNEQIPPVGRNDSSLGVEERGSIGGFAANASSPSFSGKPVISSEARNLNQTQQSEETNTTKGKKK